MNNITRTPPRPAKATRRRSRRRPRTEGYARGRETRQRIVDVAIDTFGEAGFDQASTRIIAKRANVNLGALTYYFGNKEGLYRACAEHIAQTAETQAKPVWDRLEQALNDPKLTRDDLLDLLRRFAAVANEDAIDRKRPRSWMLFITRETAEPGLAAKILFERLTQHSVNLLAALVGRIMGRPADAPETLIRAISLIGHFVVFQRMRRLMLYVLGWPDFSDGRNEIVKSVLWQQIEAALNPADSTSGKN